MKIVRPPENPINSLISFISGVITGIFIDRNLFKFKRKGCVIIDETITNETDEDITEDDHQDTTDDTSGDENADEALPDENNHQESETIK